MIIRTPDLLKIENENLIPQKPLCSNLIRLLSEVNICYL